MNEPEATSSRPEMASPGPGVPREGIFISYTQSDGDWAEWIAWTLEEAGYSTYIQAWDCRSGMNFREFMHRSVDRSERTIAVLSEEYQRSHWTSLEWTPPFDADPGGTKGLLVTVLVRRYQPYGPLSELSYIPLVGLNEPDAKARLLAAFPAADARKDSPSLPVAVQDRLKPNKPPPFPGQQEEEEPRELRFKISPRLNMAWVRFVCIGLLFLSLAYFFGSQVFQGEDGAYWDRLFNAFGDESEELTAIGIGPAWLIETFRILIVLTIALVFMPGWQFQDVAGRLIEETPLRKWLGTADGPPKEGPPSWEAKLGFGAFVFLLIIFLAVVLSHHLVSGPEYLWQTRGVPKNRVKAPVPHSEMNKYIRICILPYLFYTVYSLINFAIGVNVIMTISVTAVLTDLSWMYRWVGEFESDYAQGKISPADLRRRFKASFMSRVREVLERYYCLLVILLAGLAYVVWLDRWNLTPEAYLMEKQALLVAAVPLTILLPLSTIFFVGARGAVARQTSNPESFLRDHRTLDFYIRSLTRSRYNWVSGILLVCVLVNYLLGYFHAR